MEYKGISYSLLDIPRKTDAHVVKEIKEVEEQLRLNHLGEDLSNLRRFVQIAYFGVMLYLDLKANVWKSICNVFNLCLATKKTLDNFKRNSHQAVQDLQRAYRYLQAGKEAVALKILGKLQKTCNKMKNEAHTLSIKCSEQLEILQGIRDEVISDIIHIDEAKKKELQEENQQIMEKILSSKKEAENDYLEQIKANQRKEQRKLYEIIKQVNRFREHEAEIQEATVRSLHITKYPLYNIELIMKNVENFWEGIETYCESLGSYMNDQVEILINDKEAQPHEVIWQTDPFKRDALMCYFKWIALQEACTTPLKSVCSTLDEIQGYIQKDPDEDDAFEFVKAYAEQVIISVP